MKKLVNTVVGTALVASLVAGCGTNEVAPAEKETVGKDSGVQNTAPVETTEATEAVTVPEESIPEETTTTTVPEETTTETVPEETTTETVPVESIPEEDIPAETTAPTQAPTQQTWPEDDCPNATDWA